MKNMSKNVLFYTFLFSSVCFSSHTSQEYENIYDSKTSSTPVLIVGAGPAGLSLANVLEGYGIDYIIIDKKSPGDSLSKATGLRSETLQLFEKINILNTISKNSILLNGNSVYVDHQPSKRIVFFQGEMPNQKNLSISQDNLEKILLDQLMEKKRKVSFHTTLTEIQEHKDSITAIVSNARDSTEEKIKCNYLIGCDGGKSTVRKILGYTFEGETTPELSFTFDADVDSKRGAKIEPNEMYTFIKDESRLNVIPLPGNFRFKFLGKIEENLVEAFQDQPPSYAENILKPIIYERSHLFLRDTALTGLTFYHTASRTSSSLGTDKVFLIGDAAHLFFPAGGYGLNTAIDEAFNIGWRIASAVKKGHMEPLLRYSEERVPYVLTLQQFSQERKQAMSNEKVREERSKIESKNSARENSSSVLISKEVTLTPSIKKIDQLLPPNFRHHLSNGAYTLDEGINTSLDFNWIVKVERGSIETIKERLSSFMHKHDFSYKMFFISEEAGVSEAEDLFKPESKKYQPKKYQPKKYFALLIRPDNYVESNIFSDNEKEVKDFIQKN